MAGLLGKQTPPIRVSVGFELLPTGNIVLHDGKGTFIWQSFDSPTDTLLIGQSLKAGGVSKLVSRASAMNNIDGPYSLVMEPNRLALYYKSPNSPRPMLYLSLFIDQVSVVNLTLSTDAATAEGFLYYFEFIYFTTESTAANDYDLTYAHSGYNNTLSYLRVGIDGNLRFYTYNPNVQVYAWDVVYAFFDRDSLESECQLPERCGKFGLCQNSQCVACPTPNGLIGWSEDCEAPKVTSCKSSDFGYYKLEGVNHFMIWYTRGDGGTKQSDCESKCTKDCKCMGYFYHTVDSRCWIAYDLMTLTRVRNSTHLAYIKTPKK